MNRITMNFRLYAFLIASAAFCIPQTDCQTFKAELSSQTNLIQLEKELVKGKYKFEDLYEAALILLEKGDLEKSQNLFELASSIQPDNLQIYKYLAKIYEQTGQQERLGILAETLSGFILPDSEEDEFYETMLSSAIILNSSKAPEEAWKAFSRLSLTLRNKPGRYRKLIKTLEKKAHLPFLARVYEVLLEKKQYDEFMWGELGDYYLISGDQQKARTFLERELNHKDFEPRFIYSYALVLFNQREFPMCQVYINLGLKLTDDSLALTKLKKLQLNLSEYIYDIGADQIRKEAELLFKYGRKDLAIKRMEQLVLLSDQNANTFFEIGKILLGYPREYNTWQDGRDYLIKYANFSSIGFDDLLATCELLFDRNMYEDMASILKTLEQRFPEEVKKSDRIRIFKTTVIKSLKKGIRLFEIHASRKELLQYLRLLIDFDPYFEGAYIKLGELIEEDLSQEQISRSVISADSISATDAFLSGLERFALKSNNQSAQLHYLRAKLTTYYPVKLRNFSHEIASFKRALDADSRHHKARLALAHNYHQLNFFRQSIKELDTLLEDKDIKDQTLLQEARQLHIQNNVQSSSQAYSNENYFLVLEYMLKALQFSEGKLISLESTIWLGYAYFYAEKHSDNVELMQKSFDAFGEQHETLYLMALSKEGTYKLKEAEFWYNKVIKMGPADNMFVQECAKNRDNIIEILKAQHQQKLQQ